MPDDPPTDAADSGDRGPGEMESAEGEFRTGRAGTLDEAGEFDDADTDRFSALNPYGTDWGAAWGGSWDGISSVDSSHVAAQGSFRPALRDDANLARVPESFAFPTPAAGGRANRTRLILVGAGALTILAAVGGMAFALMSEFLSPVDDRAAGTTTTSPVSTTIEAPVRDPGAEAQLLTMLPAGYPPGACRAVSPRPGTVATVDCSINGDPGGPTSATYLLVRDNVALDAALAAAVKPEVTVVCPGNIQSPGPWRRNAAPDRVAGILVCGMQANVPTVGWTDEARMLVSVVRSDPPGPTLEQLYQWWSTHS